MAQEKMQRAQSAWETAQANEAEALGASKHTVDAGVDDLLDEIDGLLETNAEQFVRGYVQKGGQ